MEKINLYISEISDEIKRIITYVLDVHNDNIRLIYSEKTCFDEETIRILAHILKAAENVSSAPKKADECCIKWNKSDHSIEYAGEDVSDAISVLCDREKRCILGSGSGGQIFFFEAFHKGHLPDVFHHFDQISSFEQFKAKLRECEIEPFSLKDSSLFLHYRNQYYKHKETGDYWYLDTFHKGESAHYEVFDRTGKHLGEASISGLLSSDKAATSKRLKVD